MIQVTLTEAEKRIAREYYQDPTGDACEVARREECLNTFMDTLEEVLTWCAAHPTGTVESQIVLRIREMVGR